MGVFCVGGNSSGPQLCHRVHLCGACTKSFCLGSVLRVFRWAPP